MMLGSIINYLTRSTLAVAAPTLLEDLHITRAASTPGSSARSRARSCCSRSAATCSTCSGSSSASRSSPSPGRSSAWRTAWRESWQALAGLRGLLGLAEGSANPAGHEGHGRVVPGAGARARRAASFNIGASVGSMLAPPLVAWAILAYNWQAAFVITGGARSRLGRAVAVALPVARAPPRALRRGARATSRPGRRRTCGTTARGRRC